MLNDIINTFLLPTGYPKFMPDGVTLNPVVLNYINRGAKDLYDMLESDSLMNEVVLIVPRDQQVSLPPYIGGLRGMREYNWAGTIPLQEIGRPRYSSDTWKFKWRNWRYKGKNSLAQSITNAGPLTFSVVGVETTPAQIQLTGRTTNSHKIVETVTLNSTVVMSANSFLEIDRQGITCLNTPRTYDITVTDVNGNVLAVLYNNESTTEYIIVDVSAYPWMAIQGDGTNSYVETLYKSKFYKFYNLTDNFFAPGYDDAIAYRALTLWYQGKEGMEANMATYAALTKQVIDSNISNDEVGQERKVVQGNNPVYQVFRKLRNSWGYRRYPTQWWGW